MPGRDSGLFELTIARHAVELYDLKGFGHRSELEHSSAAFASLWASRGSGGTGPPAGLVHGGLTIPSDYGNTASGAYAWLRSHSTDNTRQFENAIRGILPNGVGDANQGQRLWTLFTGPNWENGWVRELAYAWAAVGSSST